MINKKQAKLIKRWTKALRSGKYLQGAEYLQSVDDDENEAFCCLGVLVEELGFDASDESSAADPEDLIKIGGKKLKAKIDDFETQYWSDAQLHPLVLEKLTGLENGDDDLQGECDDVWTGSFAYELASANDRGEDFELIADVIETRASMVDPDWDKR